jgi:predicted histidine transporter YuiF (NhaC family)
LLLLLLLQVVGKVGGAKGDTRLVEGIALFRKAAYYVLTASCYAAVLQVEGKVGGAMD